MKSGGTFQSTIDCLQITNSINTDNEYNKVAANQIK